MTRLLLHAFLFLLPFLVYGLYLAFVRKRQIIDGEAWDDAPIVKLFGAGLLLTIGVLIGLLSFANGGPDDRYVPAVFVDGEIVGGRLVEPDTQEEAGDAAMPDDPEQQAGP